MPDPHVHTPAGSVRGRTESGTAVFRGIPFAAPPVGDLRFAAPVPPREWSGILDAGQSGPAVPQSPMGPVVPPSRPDDGRGWLTLDVWTPRPDPGAGLPVMVWIHGGAYRAGDPGDPGYDGGRLARAGDVVVVTFHHRVGMEGFARIEGAPDNRGLLDDLAALRWVQESITAFGGDPGRVTVFGESAGAGAIAALLAMPASAGLFGRAITQSVPGTFFTPQLAADFTARVAADLGRSPDRESLAAVEPDALAAAGDTTATRMREWVGTWGPVAHNPTPYSPVVDGEILPTTPWRALRAGAGRGVELIAGHNRDEFRLFVAMAGMLGAVPEELAETTVRALAPDPAAFRAAFPAAGPSELFERVKSDWLFRMPSLRLAEEHVRGGGRAHVYELTMAAPAAGGALGACHALDVPLVFGNFDGGPMITQLLGEEPPGTVRAVSTAMQRAWTAFARHGDPGWPAWDDDGRATWLVDAPPAVAAYPEEVSRRLWAEHEFAPSPLLAGDALPSTQLR
ncbi:carboxylesterase/lipase family protein [Pseudonocardia parietis]|uniref:Carboxylic ester hydrolase n=1 Tax=Pseudonocardia parietis TaxID=570936 RepID=A0ABS4W4E7_9PSEU|nr:carboxylesterase family protein [Pseudonocardia parietis]MBP2371097.1 para-nitrobenzyl esterase [Pseudonocardia parietis]